MHFEFATATRIVFGQGSAETVPAELRRFGTRAVLVTGRSPGRTEWLRDALDAAGVDFCTITVANEPTVEFVREALEEARTFLADSLVAAGGGSVLDAGKAIAAMLANPGDPLDYLEVIGAGKPLPHASRPMVAVPTTAGTGSEVTRHAVLGSAEYGVKASLRSPGMLPALAIVDPLLTVDLPPPLTASTGLDALTQLIEPYVCSRANPMTDLFCEEGLRRVAHSLRASWEDGGNLPARTDMAWASLLGGLALANAGLGVVHGFAAPVGGGFHAPHGAVCAALLPHGIRANVEALSRQATGHPALERYQRVATLLTGNSAASVDEGIAWIEELVHALQIPGLGSYGVRPEHANDLALKASRTSSMKANPVQLDQETLARMLTVAL